MEGKNQICVIIKYFIFNFIRITPDIILYAENKKILTSMKVSQHTLEQVFRIFSAGGRIFKMWGRTETRAPVEY